MFWNRFPELQKSGFKLITSVISSKVYVNPPSFISILLIPRKKYQHRSSLSPFLLGVSLSSRNRVLGGTYIYAHGEASGFFVSETQHPPFLESEFKQTITDNER